MRSDNPMIVPNEGLGIAVVWHGGVTFNIHVLHDASLVGMTAVVGEEVDVFTAYGDLPERRPTTYQAYQHIVDWFDAQEQAMREEDDDA